MATKPKRVCNTCGIPKHPSSFQWKSEKCHKCSGTRQSESQTQEWKALCYQVYIAYKLKRCKTSLKCAVDDICKAYEKYKKKKGDKINVNSN